jgi:hypothetical protein
MFCSITVLPTRGGAVILGVLEVRQVDLDERKVALALAGRADRAIHGVAGSEAELPDLRGADVDVVGAGQVVGLRAAQEAEAVLDHLKGAGAGDLHALLGQRLEDREHHVLLAHGIGVLDLEDLGEGQQVRWSLILQLLQAHAGEPHLRDGVGDLGGLFRLAGGLGFFGGGFGGGLGDRGFDGFGLFGGAGFHIFVLH